MTGVKIKMANDIQHHGIIGQRWGVRRFQNQDGSLTPEGKKRLKSDNPVHEDYAKAHDKKKVSSMSDDELRRRINRLQIEQQYTRLNPNSVKKGQDYVNKLAKAGASVVALTGVAIKLYENSDKIKNIIEKTKNSVGGS